MNLINFQNFTVALALEHKLVKTNTVIKNIPKKMMLIYDIKDMKEHPKDCQLKKFWLDPNVGSVVLAKKIGEERYKDFIKTKLIENPIIELEEVGIPHQIKWNKCKLETISLVMELQQHLFKLQLCMHLWPMVEN